MSALYEVTGPEREYVVNSLTKGFLNISSGSITFALYILEAVAGTAIARRFLGIPSSLNNPS